MTKHRTPWETGTIETVAFDDDVWELYDTSTDWSQARDLAREQPDRLHELQRLWLIEAVKYGVLPLDDRFAERGNSEAAGRPELIHGSRQVVYGGLTRVPSLAMLNMANKSHAITAEVEVPEGAAADGVIAAVGGVTGGWSLYAKAGRPKYCYNFFGLEWSYVEGGEAIPPGVHQVRVEFAYDGGGTARGGEVSLFVDGKKMGRGRVARTEPFAFGEESCDVGHEAGSAVTSDYGMNGGSRFTGRVNWVEFDAGVADDDHNHLITPEERLQVAMARQ